MEQGQDINDFLVGDESSDHMKIELNQRKSSSQDGNSDHQMALGEGVHSEYQGYYSSL